MSLILTVPDEIAQVVEEAALKSGTSREQLMLNVLRTHFASLPVALQEEFEALEHASDEDFARFEQGEEEILHAAR